MKQIKTVAFMDMRGRPLLLLFNNQIADIPRIGETVRLEAHGLKLIAKVQDVVHSFPYCDVWEAHYIEVRLGRTRLDTGAR